MRHRMQGRKFNRTKAHRRALFANLAISLIQHEQIKTTLPKAKDMRRIIDRLITLSKKGSLHNRRQALAMLRHPEAVKKLFSVFPKRYEKREGGYSRVLKAGFRYGDAAPMAYIELIDRDHKAKGQEFANENVKADKATKAKASKSDDKPAKAEKPKKEAKPKAAEPKAKAKKEEKK
jgi:large subunit ribosomal protein L17